MHEIGLVYKVEAAENSVEKSQSYLMGGWGIYLGEGIHDLIKGAPKEIHHQTNACGTVLVIIQEGIP